MLRDGKAPSIRGLIAAGVVAASLAGFGFAGADLTAAAGGEVASSGGYRILLASNRDGETRAYSVRPDGSSLTPLLPTGHALAPIALSRDGGTIAYANFQKGIFVSRSDGAGLRRVVVATRDLHYYDAALSRDGKFLAFTRGDERSAIWIVGTNRRGRRRLAAGDGPDWSPNAKALVFGQPINEERSAIVVQPLHGKRRVLARGALDGRPKWSPDGRWIAYTITKSTRLRSSLYVVQPNGEHRHRVARRADSFSWSPDSRRLAFTVCCHVGIVGVDGHGLRRLRVGGVQPSAVHWSPDGRQIMLALRLGSFGDDADQIWLVGRNGRGLRRVTSDGWNTLVGWTRLAPVLPPAPPVPTEHVIDAHAVATPSPLADLSADGLRVAFIPTTTPIDCAHVTVWTPAATSLQRFRVPATCEAVSAGAGVYDVELAGSRAAWVSYGCGNNCYFTLKSATLAHPLPAPLTDNSREHSEPFWDYHVRGDGDLLVFNDGTRLVRIGAGREACQRGSRRICATLRRGAHAAPAESVSGQLIAIRERDAVATVNERGDVVRVFPFAPAEVSVGRVDGGRLIVARSGLIEGYDVATGVLEASRPLPTGYRLTDANDGIAVLIGADSVMLLRLEDGRSLTIAPGDGPVLADLEPPGLYYSYVTGTEGRVVFVPRSDLFR